MSRRLSTLVTGPSRERGITVLEILIMVVIVGVVAAIGVPTIHARSKSAVLDANVQSLAALVQEEALAGRSYEYHPDGGDDGDTYLSSHLETLLREAVGKSRYTNPCASTRTSRTISSSTEIATDPDTAPPAVFLTNSPACRYDTFDTQPFDSTRSHLVGAIVVHFDKEALNVDVYFVDAAGNKSARVIRVPMA